MLYRSRCLLIPLLCVVAALAQPYKQDPVEAAVQAVDQLHRDGNYDAAVAKREEARALLDRVPVATPNFQYIVQRVTQLYQQAGKTTEVRAILQSALDRSVRLGDAHPTRLGLLSSMASSWQSDGSLLKAVPYLEQAVSAVESHNSHTPAADPNGIYQQLAGLYRETGRPEAADAVLAKVQARLKSNPSMLASFYEGQGRLDDAEALYQQLGDLQSLARVYARNERPGDAAVIQQQAIAMVRGSGDPNASNNLMWMRQALAGYLQQAGDNNQAEATYRQMISEAGPGVSQPVIAYAQFLCGTQRQVKAQKVLADYLESHPDDPNLLNYAAAIAADNQTAEAYRSAARKSQLPGVTFTSDPIMEELQKAQSAANAGRLDEAFFQATHAIAATSSARPYSFPMYMVTTVANCLAPKQPARAEELYRNLVATVESWSADTVQPLEGALSAYARFLSNQPERQGAAAAATDRYRAVVSRAHGDDAGARDALTLAIQSERAHGSWSRALFLTQEQLRLEESLNGPTSQPYLSALETLASIHEQSCHAAEALPLYRQIVAIGDLTAAPSDQQRVWRRTNAATSFASQGQFDEAERLAKEAIAIGSPMRPRPKNVDQTLQQIRQMKKNAQTNPAASQTTCFGFPGGCCVCCPN